MATLLLIVIYIAFIGLGLPDSLFGTAWPAVYAEFNVPVSLASVVSLISCFGTFLSSLSSARVINRFGTGRVTAFCTLLTAAGLFGYSLSPSFFWMCLLAVPMGLGAGAIDTALNNYVALHYSASHMNFLHCFYGIGVTVSPYFMSLALAGAGNWRGGYRLAFWVQICISCVMFIALPLWNRVRHGALAAEAEEEPVRTLSMREMAKLPSVRAVWLVFITSCGVEVTTGAWSSTYLVQAKGMALDAAARAVMLYYFGFALGRLLSGLLSSKLTSWQLIKYSEIIMFVAIPFLLLPLGSFVASICLFLIGLGCGPVFPNMTYLTPLNFGRDVSQSVIGSQMAAAYIGIMALPPLFGLLAQFISAWLLPLYLLVMMALMVYATLRLTAQMKKEGRYQG
ncbi:MAG: MFS transporter [Clostridia bacterium]|nr:MFS transporter [Clostridia bacterium]